MSNFSDFSDRFTGILKQFNETSGSTIIMMESQGPRKLLSTPYWEVDEALITATDASVVASDLEIKESELKSKFDEARTLVEGGFKLGSSTYRVGTRYTKMVDNMKKGLVEVERPIKDVGFRIQIAKKRGDPKVEEQLDKMRVLKSQITALDEEIEQKKHEMQDRELPLRNASQQPIEWMQNDKKTIKQRYDISLTDLRQLISCQ